jgi:4-carboxymuconolactone decarboxylase
MDMADSRDALRSLGGEVLADLRHGTYPPRARELYQSDVPGLGSYTTEALWGSVWARPALGRRDRLLATMAVMVAVARLEQLRTYFNSALNVGVDPLELHEMAIQCSVHAGFPVTVNALELLRDVLEVRNDTVELPDVAAVPIDELDRRGRALHLELFGSVPPVDDFGSAAGALTTVELRFAFGEILSRPGLDLRGRVIVAIAVNLALRDVPEVARWMGAGLRVGLTKVELDEVLLQCAHYIGLAPARRALNDPSPPRR